MFKQSFCPRAMCQKLIMCLHQRGDQSDIRRYSSTQMLYRHAWMHGSYTAREHLCTAIIEWWRSNHKNTFLFLSWLTILIHNTLSHSCLTLLMWYEYQTAFPRCSCSIIFCLFSIHFWLNMTSETCLNLLSEIACILLCVEAFTVWQILIGHTEYLQGDMYLMLRIMLL